MADSVMSDIDWDEGIAMPVANVENKTLENELAETRKEISLLTNDLSGNDDRVHAMSQHLQNVRRELTHNMALIDAYLKDFETEEHMISIAQREDGRLNQEVQRLEKDLTLLRDQHNSFENKIFLDTQQLENLKSQMNWDQEALEAWLEESARRDEDAITLNKYTRQDESKVKELGLLIKHLTEEAQQKRKFLDQETTETLSAQIELDKTAEEFRKSHSTRLDLIRQWEITIEQMQRRDREMDQAAVELARTKEDIRLREQIIAEKQLFLENESENNQEMEKKIASQERLAAKLRIQYQEHENNRMQLEDELDTLKYTVERTATDLESIKSSVTGLKKEIVSKNLKLQQATLTREQLQDKLSAANQGVLSAEEQAALAEEMLNKEEESLKEFDQELRRIRDLHFKKKEELHTVMTSEKNVAASIQGSRAASKNLSSRLNKLDQQSVKQQEIIYNQDFTIQQLERRIARMRGEINTEEKKELEARIASLTASLEDKNNIHIVLTTQLKRLQDDIRRQKRDMDKTGTEKSGLTSKIEELELHNEISQKELKETIETKQSSMVEDSILKLEIKRLTDMLNEKADNVFSLEKRNLQLATAMKERQKEITIHKDMIFSQTKAAEEERKTINAELHQRLAKIDKLRKRYEILMVSMAPPEGEEVKSQAYYVIKAAQDKEELQRKGDEVDAKIRKAEKEIRALENTLRLLNSRNETYRKSFNKVTETSEEYETKAQLDEKLRALMDKYKYKRRQIRELQEDLQTMSSAMDTASRDETAYMEMVQERKSRLAQLQKDLEEQAAKADRVMNQIYKTTREVRTQQSVKGPIQEEKDIDLRSLRERNRNISKQVSNAVQQFPEMYTMVEMYYHQVGLPVPTAKPSSQGSRSSSVRSSARSSPRSVLSSVGSPEVPADDFGMRVTSPAGSQRSRQSSARSSRSGVGSRQSRP
ncbi:coiled-coil domain-containing protein 39-like [Styela clava]